MSLIPEIVTSLNKLNKQVGYLESLGGINPSIILPVQEQILPGPSNNNTRILMDHPRLPTMQEFGFYGWYTAMGHNLANEFVYECAAQDYSGFFHLIGDPGLFSVGTTNGWLNQYGNSQDGIFNLHVNRRGEPENNQLIQISSAEQKSIFLGSNDSFYFDYDPYLNNNVQITVGSNTEIAITRLSGNPKYISPGIIPG